MAVLFGVLALVWGFEIPKRDYDNKNYFIFELDTSKSTKPLVDFIKTYKEVYQFEHPVRGFDDHFVFSLPKNHSHNEFIGNYNSNNHNVIQKRQNFERDYDSLIENKDLKSIHVLKPKKLVRRMPVPIEPELDSREFQAVDSSQLPLKEVADKLDINDPIFAEQWHLVNVNYPGHDVNVTGLWYEGITGKGIVTSVIDDGLDLDSEDLKDNFNAKGSWDFNDNTNLPKPRLFNDYHGTRCAGEIAAVKNDVCGVGVAYDSQVSGVRILSGSITSEDEAAAMIFGLDVNDIYSCSWGPTDDGKTLSAPELIVKKAMVKGIQEGRKKKGSIYVFASGNGGRYQDSCNFDGYTNSIYSVTVGAIDHKGLHPNYAEACSAVMVVTYSSGSGEHIHTTDIHDKCSSQHGGTSAAAPLAAGIFSLVLQANPELTWRDLQYVAALSSVPVNEDTEHYQETALGRKYSHKYGYGKIDAYKMAKFAQTWKNVKPQSWYYSDVTTVDEHIKFNQNESQDKNKIIKSTINVHPRELKVINLERIEHVTVTVNIGSTFRGQVGIRLISPTGITSDLATFRPRDRSGAGFIDWTFLSVAHWGEKGDGDWTLQVFNSKDSTGNDIHFTDWQLRFFGESIDADKAEEYDIEKDYAKIRRDKLYPTDGESVIEVSSTVAPESSEVPTKSEGEIISKTEVNEVKPSEEKAISSETDSDATDEPELSDDPEETSEPEEGKEPYTSDHKGIYFMALVVIGFGVILLIMKYHKTPGSSRRRRRRDEYEFDIISGEDYSDSDSHDSLDLGHRNDAEYQVNEERDRLYDELNSEALPDYEQDEEMFKIGEEGEVQDTSKVAPKDDKKSEPQDTGAGESSTDSSNDTADRPAKKVNFKQ